ncbi:MAG TPA: hypothetical protein VK982_16445, partial [Bacteroidales bacterium]|nr:hypothetical protein [Bacteroidales bacterium]
YGPDRNRSYNIYTQNDVGLKIFKHNIIFSSSHYGWHIYTESGELKNMELDGNITFYSGNLHGLTQSELIIGSTTKRPENITIKNSVFFSKHYRNFSIGNSSPENTSVKFTDNYVVGENDSYAYFSNNWDSFESIGNTFIADITGFSVWYDINLNNAAINRNKYYSLNSRAIHNMSFSEWQNTQGFDLDGEEHLSMPVQNKVFVFPNAYESKRAHISVFNWENIINQDVDCSAFLNNGDTYYVYDVQNMQTVVATGTYNGIYIQLPLNLTAVQQPYGNLGSNAIHTPTLFNCFIISNKLLL